MKVTSYFIPNENFRVGTYQPTGIDKQKEEANILITACNGGTYTVMTRGIELSGRGVKTNYGKGFYEITEKFYRELETRYIIMPDF